MSRALAEAYVREVYTPEETQRVRQQLKDAEEEAKRWDREKRTHLDRLEQIGTLRSKLTDWAALLFLVGEERERYSDLEHAEGRLASARRKVREAKSFLDWATLAVKLLGGP